jgi:TfoX C-terminal domain
MLHSRSTYKGNIRWRDRKTSKAVPVKRERVKSPVACNNEVRYRSCSVTGSDSKEVGRLRNLGPKSERWLNAVGIFTRQDLESLGPVQAFARVKAHGYRPSLNLLYALAGALLDCRWDQLPEEERSRLILEFDALEAVQRPN